jgi:hypothetical protein
LLPPECPRPSCGARKRLFATGSARGIADLKCTTRVYHFDYPFPPESVVDFFRINYGPVSRAFASLDGSAQRELRRELVLLWTAHNDAVDGTTRVDAEYLEVIATRG